MVTAAPTVAGTVSPTAPGATSVPTTGPLITDSPANGGGPSGTSPTESPTNYKGAGEEDKVTEDKVTKEGIPWWFWVLLALLVICCISCAGAWFRAYKRRKNREEECHDLGPVILDPSKFNVPPEAMTERMQSCIQADQQTGLLKEDEGADMFSV